jgi:hypothetical protein
MWRLSIHGRRCLDTHPALFATVNDVVLEFGNALYQA